MDLVNDEASIIAQEEDRISNLADDVIHRILSFLDMTFAIQTSTLSRRWKHIWTSMPYLKLNNRLFHSMPQFAKFVKHVLCHRNSRTEVSTVELTLTGRTNHSVVESIINYAYLYNCGKLTIIWSTSGIHDLPQYLFSSRTLKHLILNDQSHLSSNSRIPNSAWDFPALETLNLANLYIGTRTPEEKSLDLFSKCVNLQDITLRKVIVFGFEIVDVCAPQLLNLSITDCSIYSEVFNVFASQLTNLTISGHNRFPQVSNLVAPQLKNLTATASTGASSPYFLPLFTEGLNSLERVSLSLRYSYEKKTPLSGLLNLFQILRSAKYLILDVYIVESLSSGMDQLKREPCPFDNLKCLKINAVPLKPKDPIPIIPTQVRNYLLENSPRATFIMDLPQVPKKRSRQLVPNDTNTMANKVAKVEEGKKQPPTMADEKKLLEAQIQMQVQVIAKQRAFRKKQNHVIKKQKAKIRMQDQAIAKQMAKINKQNRVIAKQKAKILMQNANNVQSRSGVSAELSPVPRQSSTTDQSLSTTKFTRDLEVTNSIHGKSRIVR